MNYTNKPFFMVRHGETVANKDGVAAGIFDTPLTEKGREQAIHLERIIFGSKLHLNYIVHSGLSRARDTAVLLNQRFDLPLFENKKLAEQNFGDWQGMNWKEMMGLIRSGHTPPGGESPASFYERAAIGIQESLCILPGMPLLVTHGGIFDAFFDSYGLKEIDVKNCALYECLLEKKEDSVIGYAKEYSN